MKCPECIGPPRREITHEVTLPPVQGAQRGRIERVCFYHASGYEMVKGAVITRIGSTVDPDDASDPNVAAASIVNQIANRD